jgi:hypothetical protein
MQLMTNAEQAAKFKEFGIHPIGIPVLDKANFESIPKALPANFFKDWPLHYTGYMPPVFGDKPSLRMLIAKEELKDCIGPAFSLDDLMRCFVHLSKHDFPTHPYPLGDFWYLRGDVFYRDNIKAPISTNNAEDFGTLLLHLIKIGTPANVVNDGLSLSDGLKWELAHKRYKALHL